MAGPVWGPDVDGHEVSSFYEGRLTSYPLLRIKPGTKVPTDRGWSSLNRSPAEPGPWRRKLIGYHGRLALVTGAGFGVLDVDLDVEGAAESYERLLFETGLDPRTPTVRTPSGGFHKYLRVQQPARSGPVKGYVGLDFKCEGGFVLCPPTESYDWGETA